MNTACAPCLLTALPNGAVSGSGMPGHDRCRCLSVTRRSKPSRLGRAPGLAVAGAGDPAAAGWIEVQFGDVRGKRWSLADRVPLFDAPEDLGPGSACPPAVMVACVMIDAYATTRLS